MGNFFYWLFSSIRPYKRLAGVILAASVAVMVYLALQLRLEENIFDIIPQNQDVAAAGVAIEELPMNNRLVIHLYLADSSRVAPDTLVAFAKNFSDSLQARAGMHIRSILDKFPDSQVQTLYNYYFENLPFYLEESDYQQLEERVSAKNITSSIDRFYRSLMSPMGLATKKILLSDPLGFASFPLERSRSFQIDDNFALYKNHILTTDKKHLVFFINLANPASETGENGKLIQAIDGQISSMQDRWPGVKAEYFGSAAVAVANAEQIRSDIFLTVTLAVILLFLFISLFYRGVGTFFLVVTPGVFGALTAISVLVLTRDAVSVISLAVGSVLLGITIDYALHFRTHYKMQKDLPRLFADLGFPTLMCGITTACAFFALFFIRSKALQDLGIFAGVSVLSASIFTLVVLPHFVIRGSEKETPERRENFVERAVANLARYPLQKKKWAIFLFVLLTTVSLFTWKNIAFDSNMLRLNFMPSHLAQYEKNINAISTFSANNIYEARSGSDFWEALESNQIVEDSLLQMEQSGAITGYLSLNKLVPSKVDQEEKLDRWNAFWYRHGREVVTANIDSAAVVTGFNPGTFHRFDSLIQQNQSGIHLDEVEKLLGVFGGELVIRHANGQVSLLSSIKVDADKKQDVLRRLASIPGIVILDRGFITNQLVDILAGDFNRLVNISLGIVFLILLISYGRIELTTIAFAPILISWLWVLGLMGLLGLTFNIVNIIICTFIFGLGIDYSIFNLRGMLQTYSTNVSNLQSYKKSIILSAVTTLTGIGVLAFAKHPALQSIAFLAIIGILSVIFITFTLQPLLFHWLIGHRKEKGVVPFTLSSLFFTFFAFFQFLSGCVVLFILRILFFLPLGSLKFRKYIFHWVMMISCRSLIYCMANIKKVVIDRHLANYEKPAVIIANHHSFIDILVMLMFHPKVVLVTNDWVSASPFFGKSVQFAGFIQASKGLENQTEHIENLIRDGYSIAVFPEGSRSGLADLRRFHKGAFLLAEKFKLDIQPILMHGTSHVMPKGDAFYVKSNPITFKFLPRIAHDDPRYGTTYSERTKAISKHFRKEYDQLRTEIETPHFFKEILIKNFIYKSPVLEWYLRIKFRFEKSYQLFHELIPRQCRVVDLGCGYGFMTYALGLSSRGRDLTGIDYDERKIQMAGACPVHPENIRFEAGDVVAYNNGPADVFLLCDVLHYMQPEEQTQMLNTMLSNLNDEGMIIIRDGDSSKTERHKGSVLTEVFSTGSGFNKTRNKLNFIPAAMIENFAEANDLELTTIDNTKRTSNVVFVLRRRI